MECDVADTDTNCYLLKGGEVFKAEWYQPIEAEEYSAVGNFRMTGGLTGVAACIYNQSSFGQVSFTTESATKTMVGTALIVSALALY